MSCHRDVVEVIKEFNGEQQKKFLKFVAGCYQEFKF